jgi:hypothetical protein
MKLSGSKRGCCFQSATCDRCALVAVPPPHARRPVPKSLSTPLPVAETARLASHDRVDAAVRRSAFRGLANARFSTRLYLIAPLRRIALFLPVQQADDDLPTSTMTPTSRSRGAHQRLVHRRCRSGTAGLPWDQQRKIPHQFSQPFRLTRRPAAPRSHFRKQRF